MIFTKNHSNEMLEEIELAIKNNDGYCCCKFEKTEDTLCPCKEFRESKQLGECECGRYIKTEI